MNYMWEVIFHETWRDNCRVCVDAMRVNDLGESSHEN